MSELDRADYEGGIERLITRARLIHTSDYSPTPKRKEIERIAGEIKALADLLDLGGSAQSEIEQYHDAVGKPETRVGENGLPVESAAPAVWSRYTRIKSDLYGLAWSAQEAAKSLPDPREKPAIKFAALAFLHLRYRHGFSLPALSNDSTDVAAFGEVWAAICGVKAVPLSKERLRGALGDALSAFDPNYFPPGIDEVVIG